MTPSDIIRDNSKTKLLLDRMIRAAYLDRRVYEEVAADRGASGYALLVVLLTAVATWIGSLDQNGFGGPEAFKALPGEIVIGFIGWVVWTSLTYVIGTKLLPAPETDVSWSAMARAVGFAHSPATLRALGILPGLGILIPLVTILWQLVAMVVATRQTLHYQSHWRAVGIVAIGFIPTMFIVGTLRLLVTQS